MLFHLPPFAIKALKTCENWREGGTVKSFGCGVECGNNCKFEIDCFAKLTEKSVFDGLVLNVCTNRNRNTRGLKIAFREIIDDITKSFPQNRQLIEA